MAYSIEIRDTDGNKYRFFEAEVPSATFSVSVQRFKLNEPDGDGTNNLSINLGTDRKISIPFKLLNTPDDDASVGTSTTEINTISEKLYYLNGKRDIDGVSYVSGFEPFIQSGIDDFYFVDITSHNGDFLNNKVQLDDISFNPQSQSPNSLSGSISFTIGGGYQ